MNRREFEASVELTETELTPMEFIELAQEEMWDPHTVALLVGDAGGTVNQWDQ